MSTNGWAHVNDPKPGSWGNIADPYAHLNITDTGMVIHGEEEQSEPPSKVLTGSAYWDETDEDEDGVQQQHPAPALPTNANQPTDEDILSGTLEDLRGHRLLQVLRTHSNRETLDAMKRNAAGKEVISSAGLSSRIQVAVTSEAKKLKVPYPEAREQFNNVRIANGVEGVIRRVNKTAAAKPSPKSKIIGKRQRDQSEEAEPSEYPPISKKARARLGDDIATEAEDDNDEPADGLTLLRKHCEELLTKEPKFLRHDRLLEVAQVFNNEQIATKVNESYGEVNFNPGMVSDRLGEAYGFVAARDGVSRDVVRENLRTTRTTNGVRVRFDTSIRKKRTEWKTKSTLAQSEDQVADDDDGAESEDDDPLADLEEMGRREEGQKKKDQKQQLLDQGIVMGGQLRIQVQHGLLGVSSLP